MKIFIYKFLISLAGIFILYQLTIGLTIKKIEGEFIELYSKENAEVIKKKIREEILNGIKKDKILSDEDVRLLRQLYFKIQNELKE